MIEFKSLGITPYSKGMEGEKIKIDKVLNRKITVYSYKVEDSKFTDKCLHIQISVDNSMRVLFTGSKVLLETIERVPKESFPFATTIVKENDRFMFT